MQLSDSGLALGITNALQFGPLVFFGLYGGVIADRFDRRRLLIVTQSALALLAAVIGSLLVIHLIQLWMIWVAAVLLGLIMSIDKPALLSFVKDLVGEADLPNVVALNNAVISSGRMIGPVISGLLIASFGTAPSFFINAISFGLVVLVLMIVTAANLHVTRPAERKPGQVREALSYIRHDRALAVTVTAMAVVFAAAYNFQVVVPLLASRMLGGCRNSGCLDLVEARKIAKVGSSKSLTAQAIRRIGALALKNLGHQRLASLHLRRTRRVR